MTTWQSRCSFTRRVSTSSNGSAGSGSNACRSAAWNSASGGRWVVPWSRVPARSVIHSSRRRFALADVGERLAGQEAAFDEVHARLDLPLVLRRPRAGRAHQETVVLGHPPVGLAEHRVVQRRLQHGRLEIVRHDAPWDAAEPLEGVAVAGRARSGSSGRRPAPRTGGGCRRGSSRRRRRCAAGRCPGRGTSRPSRSPPAPPRQAPCAPAPRPGLRADAADGRSGGQTCSCRGSRVPSSRSKMVIISTPCASSSSTICWYGSTVEGVRGRRRRWTENRGKRRDVRKLGCYRRGNRQHAPARGTCSPSGVRGAGLWRSIAQPGRAASDGRGPVGSCIDSRSNEPPPSRLTRRDSRPRRLVISAEVALSRRRSVAHIGRLWVAQSGRRSMAQTRRLCPAQTGRLSVVNIRAISDTPESVPC